jgi:hypothetical protein
MGTDPEKYVDDIRHPTFYVITRYRGTYYWTKDIGIQIRYWLDKYQHFNIQYSCFGLTIFRSNPISDISNFYFKYVRVRVRVPDSASVRDSAGVSVSVSVSVSVRVSVRVIVRVIVRVRVDWPLQSHIRVPRSGSARYNFITDIGLSA